MIINLQPQITPSDQVPHIPILNKEQHSAMDDWSIVTISHELTEEDPQL
jgi:hypothetical protein